MQACAIKIVMIKLPVIHTIERLIPGVEHSRAMCRKQHDVNYLIQTSRANREKAVSENYKISQRPVVQRSYLLSWSGR